MPSAGEHRMRHAPLATLPATAPVSAVNHAEESIGLLISRCLNRLTDATAAFLTEFDLNSQQFGVLHSIYRGRASTPSALARLCFTNTAAITYTLDQLEKKKLLVRT